MAKRSVVFSTLEQLKGYAKRAGITLDKLWETIEVELTRQPRTHQIVIHGPKQVVKIQLRKDLRKLKKQTFARADLGDHNQSAAETENDIQREEDAGKESEPTISDIVDKKNISDMSPGVKKGHNRTPWPLGKTEARKPRYPIPEEKPNRFYRLLSAEHRERRKLFREKWAEANRTHDWPSWLVCDYHNYFAAEILQWVHPNLFTSEEEKHQAGITLEAINVFLRGHKPSENSPLYGVKEKSIAKRVQRFLKDAAKWWGVQVFINECEAAYDRAEVACYMKELYEQATTEGDLKYINELEKNLDYVPEDESDDDVVRLWKKRLDDED